MVCRLNPWPNLASYPNARFLGLCELAVHIYRAEKHNIFKCIVQSAPFENYPYIPQGLIYLECRA